MDLIKCPRCGEMYSSSYRRCPFCEEEDRPRKANRRGGHHVSERKQTHSARGSLLAVLIVVLVVLSWYLFGGKFMERIQNDRNTPSENVDPTPTNPDTPDPSGDDPGADPAPVDPDAPAPPVVDDPDTSEPDPAAVDVSGATLNREDFTLNAGESFQMSVTGTTAAPVWSVKDASVASVSEGGLVKGVNAGDTSVYAKVGDRTLECIVRVKGSSNGTSTTVDASGAKLNKTDFTISVGEKTQLKVTGTTASVSWSIGNSGVASIGTDGTVAGLKAGTTTAYAKVGGRTLECIVRVK